MPQWGDPNHDWNGIWECVDILQEALPDSHCKEKFGHVRCYVFSLDPKQYRKAYEKAVAKHPELARYILCDADYPEYLKGIVKEEDCDHPGWWQSSTVRRCAVCGKNETL